MRKKNYFNFIFEYLLINCQEFKILFHNVEYNFCIRTQSSKLKNQNFLGVGKTIENRDNHKQSQVLRLESSSNEWLHIKWEIEIDFKHRKYENANCTETSK